jgi:hypothetical protein
VSFSGTEIFDDDIAWDVRDIYREMIDRGLSPADATREVLAEFREMLDARISPGDEDVFWLALAATQLENGSIETDVRARALAIIETESDRERFRPEDWPARKLVHERLRRDLVSP